jgi:hypothetical protein
MQGSSCTRKSFKSLKIYERGACYLLKGTFLEGQVTSREETATFSDGLATLYRKGFGILSEGLVTSKRRGTMTFKGACNFSKKKNFELWFKIIKVRLLSIKTQFLIRP